MTLFKISIVLLLLFDSLFVHAQVGKTVFDTTIVAIKDLPEIKHDTDSIIENLKREIYILKNEVADLKDSKEREIKSKDAEIKRLNKYLIFADSVIARISNDCLRKKYDSVRVTEALAYFRKMYSPELQNKFKRLEQLLNEYLNDSKEIRDILAEAENDPEIKNPFTGQRKAVIYKNKIESTRYFKEVYNSNWTIPYLNNVIDRVIKALSVFDPKISKEIKLLDNMN